MTEEKIVEYFTKKQQVTILTGLCNGCGDDFFTVQKDSHGYCSNQCRSNARPVNPPKASRDRYIHQPDGYVMVRAWDHPKASKYGKHVREHVLVMEKVIGRYLRPGENIHHRDGNRQNNDPKNLELWNRSQPCGQRVVDLVDFVAENYEKEVIAKIEVKRMVRDLTESVSFRS